jgi:hypothetical protein
MAEPGAFDHITFAPGKMGGRACIHGMRITAGTIVGLVAEGETAEGFSPPVPTPSRKTSTGSRLRRLAHLARTCCRHDS